MKDILVPLKLADYEAMVKIIEPWSGFRDADPLPKALFEYNNTQSEANKNELMTRLEYAIRYYGSSDIAYAARLVFSDEPGVTFDEIINDVARKLKVKLKIAPRKNKVIELTKKVVSKELSKMKADEIRKLLKEQGINEDLINDIIKKHGRNITIAAIATVFKAEVVQKLITSIIIKIMARYMGKEAAKRIFSELAKKFPWWAEWIGPIAWVVTGVWAAIDIAGPAYRKTIPICLYLGIALMREESGTEISPEEE